MRRLVIGGVALVLTLGPGSALAESETTPSRSGAFELAGSMSSGRFGHAAALLPDGRVLVVGGQADDGFTRKTEVWDPATATFTTTGRLRKGRMLGAAATLPDGRVLVVGGEGENGIVRTAELWDPDTGVFERTGGPRQPRFWADATALADGSVVIIGGSGNRYQRTIETWDPVAGKFRVSGKLPEPRALHTTTLLPDGRLLIVGGATEDRTKRGGGRDWRALDDAHVWDPAASTLTPAGSMSTERSHHTATLLPDGRVIVIGGSTMDDTIASAEIWDPMTNAFSPTGSLAEPRESHSATALPDGRVLVVGGISGGGERVFAATELWDPSTGQFEPSGPLLHARARHTAHLLPDGRVLVIGGGGTIPAVSTAEVWDPAAMAQAPAPPAVLTLAACVPDLTDPALETLEASFPASLEGVPVEALACHGPDWLAMQGPGGPASASVIERAQALVDSVGASVEDLSIATALHEPVPGQVATITALRVEGAIASGLVDGAIPLLLGIERPSIRQRQLGPGGVETIEVRDETIPGSYPTTLYAPLGDTLWLVTAHKPRLLADIVAALPGPGGHFEAPELGVAITFPDEWRVEPLLKRMGKEKRMGADAIGWAVVAAGSNDETSRSSCQLNLIGPTDLSTVKVMRRLTAEAKKAPKPEALEGGLFRVAGPGSFFGGDIDTALYARASDDAVVVLFCFAETAPGDLWLPLAKSIEFIPVGEAVPTSAPGPEPQPTVLEG